ncbi:hypothetical protein LguiA_011370 [Lonicera macranthoides]
MIPFKPRNPIATFTMRRRSMEESRVPIPQLQPIISRALIPVLLLKKDSLIDPLANHPFSIFVHTCWF